MACTTSSCEFLHIFTITRKMIKAFDFPNYYNIDNPETVLCRKTGDSFSVPPNEP